MDRKEQAAEQVKEAYEYLRDGDVESIKHTDVEGDLWTRLLISSDDADVVIQIERGRAKGFR
jgi:hypothetical protein